MLVRSVTIAFATISAPPSPLKFHLAQVVVANGGAVARIVAKICISSHTFVVQKSEVAQNHFAFDLFTNFKQTFVTVVAIGEHGHNVFAFVFRQVGKSLAHNDV